MVWERIPSEEWRNQKGHIDRYKMAEQWINDGDIVIDAACGIGYGSQILTENKTIQYHGVDTVDAIDKQFLLNGWFTAQDLNTWTPEFSFDVAVCFETLEHLDNFDNMVSWSKKARRMIIVSVPTVPTKHMNEYHLHDFTVDDIVNMFDGVDMEIIAQPEELSHIFKIMK